MRLGILASHPIQYHAPWFRALAKQVDLEVFFAYRQNAQGQADAGFGVKFDWDVDLLSGYKHHFLKNVSTHPGLGTYGGCDTPEISAIVQGQRTTDYMTTGQRTPLTRPPATLSPLDGERAGRGDFDAFLIMGWNRKSFVQGIRACRRAKVPILMRGDSQLHTPRSRLKSLAKYLPYRWMLPRLDAHLYVGQRNKEYLRHYGVREEQLFFAPHFVDNDWFSARAAEVRSQKSEIRRKWGIPVDAFVAMFCGKFIPKKRPLDLVKAASVLLASGSELPPAISKIHLLFVGAGELGPQLRSACHVVFDADVTHSSDGRGIHGGNSPNPDSRLESPKPMAGLPLPFGRGEGWGEGLHGGGKSAPRAPNVALPTASFLGFKNQSELPACYVAADVLVLPSESETWGLTVNEAMACGLPAIVSDAVGCAPDLIEEGQTGSTFPVGDTECLARKLLDWARQKYSGQNASPRILEKANHYSMDQATTGLMQAIGGLMRRELPVANDTQT